MTRTLYSRGRIFTADSPAWAESLVTESDTLIFVGDDADAREIAGEGAAETDLDGRVVLPGFLDVHTHLLMLGESLSKVALTDARNLEEIQRRLAGARAADPEAPRLLGRGWLFDSIGGEKPTAAMIDAVVSDVPVYLDANDVHSCWVNSAALAELQITDDTPDPLGGRISRDDDGHADGMLYETAVQQLVWPLLAEFGTDADRDDAIERMLAAYSGAGVTSVVDMAFNENGLSALNRAASRRGGSLPLHVAAHWLVTNTDDDAQNLEQVKRAAGLAQETANAEVRIVGIKLVLDGVIDACTAAMRHPYADGSNAEPVWPPSRLNPVVSAADLAGLQIAMHAIGDTASDIALDALEQAARENGPLPRRHRIEHLEYAAPETAQRMAALGVTASMQPVHADPAIFDNWAAMLGDERVDRAFPWKEYIDAGALLTFSTDAPTAPHHALANIYVAATRRSALDPTFTSHDSAAALPLTEAITHATADAAASVNGAEKRGRLIAGYEADFAVLDVDPFRDGPEVMLTGGVALTIARGNVIHHSK